MGALPFAGGAAFRVWAPHAGTVTVAGDFNDWSTTSHPLAHEGSGYWSGEVAGARPSHRYRFIITNGRRKLRARDPYAQDVRHSHKSPVITDRSSFDWGDDNFRMLPWNELVLYEMHIGAFNNKPGGRPGTCRTAMEKLDHLVDTGVNVISLIPTTELRGSFSWGYNTAFPFAVESHYGGLNDAPSHCFAARNKGLSETASSTSPATSGRAPASCRDSPLNVLKLE